MKINILCMWLSAILSFYSFKYLDLFLALVLTSLAILFQVLRGRNYTTHSICRSLIAGALGALLGYLCAFRYAISLNLAHTNQNIFYTLLSLINIRWDIKVITKNWYTLLLDSLDRDSAALIIALSTGQQNFIHLAFSDLVRRTGISHLLALSGFHLSIIIIGLEYVWGFLHKISKTPIHKLLRDCISFVIVWFYCIFIGFIPSLYRAALMFSIASLFRLYYGSASFYRVWGLSGIILLFFTPSVMFSHGFILSMLALIGVELGLKLQIYTHKYMSPILAAPLCIGIIASITTLWYTYIFFGASYPIGIIATILLTPLVTLIMILGVLLLTLLSIHRGLFTGLDLQVLVSKFEFLEGILAILTGLSKLLLSQLSSIINFLTRIILIIISYSANIITIDSIPELVAMYVILGLICLIFYVFFRKIQCHQLQATQDQKL